MRVAIKRLPEPAVLRDVLDFRARGRNGAEYRWFLAAGVRQVRPHSSFGGANDDNGASNRFTTGGAVVTLVVRRFFVGYYPQQGIPLMRTLCLALAGLLVSSAFIQAEEKSDWVQMFDGKTLKGWKVNE